MTWEGRCPECRGRLFVITVNSSDDVHVNCAKDECSTYLGKIPAQLVLRAPIAEAH